jgi:hypothetical protein
MTSRKLKAEVRINDTGEWNGSAVELLLDDVQARSILETLVTGQELRVNLVTGTRYLDQHVENPKAYAQ